jgi:hypothetical protein
MKEAILFLLVVCIARLALEIYIFNSIQIARKKAHEQYIQAAREMHRRERAELERQYQFKKGVVWTGD